MIDAIIDMINANNPFLIIISGLMIGLLHAFEPDHLSAISTQIVKNKERDSKQDLRNWTISSSFRGALWGMGHTSSIILIGLLVAGFALTIPENFFVSAEIVVGIMLIVLGILTIRNRGFLKQKHTHPHKHSNGVLHTHPHDHNDNHKHGHKAYLIGCIHGIAGSGSLVAIAASTITSFDMIVYFLVLFGIGSIIGMTAASGILGLPFILLSKMSLVTRYLRYAIAGVTFVIGFNIVFTIGLDSKLFF